MKQGPLLVFAGMQEPKKLLVADKIVGKKITIEARSVVGLDGLRYQIRQLVANEIIVRKFERKQKPLLLVLPACKVTKGI